MQLSNISPLFLLFTISSGVRLLPLPSNLFSGLDDDTQIKCGGEPFDLTPDIASCTQALEKMPRSDQRRTYGARSARAKYKVALPLRYLSDDGLCAIDVNQITNLVGKVGDITSDLTIAASAGALLTRCVAQNKVGGTVFGFSKYLINLTS